MATKTQVNNFIAQLSALAIAEAKRRSKWVLPSVCIAQAALETGWGTSSLMTKANAYFGIKATGWKGKVYNSATLECYDGKTYTQINDCFRAYDSVKDSVKDYYDLITGAARYQKAVCEKDAKKAIAAIKNGGYATDPTYVSKIVNIIETYNLTKYDADIIGTKKDAPTASEYDTYTVQKGDSLWKIANDKLGDGSRYVEIKKLNGMMSNLIHAGQVLKIPSTGSTKPSAKPSTVVKFKVGDKIKLTDNAVYSTGQSVPAWVRKCTLYVRSDEFEGGYYNVSILKVGAITGRVNKKYMNKA